VVKERSIARLSRLRVLAMDDNGVKPSLSGKLLIPSNSVREQNAADKQTYRSR